MKNMLERKDISSFPKLTTAIRELGSMDLSRDYLKKLRNSMLARVQMVICQG
jgi:hypothetical protein